MSSQLIRLLLAFFLTTTALALPTNTISSTSTPNIPLNGLPAPDPSLQLKHIALGLGTQNYTCANTSTTPLATGALATLYDASLLRSPAHAGLIPSFAAVANATNSTFGLQTLGRHWFSAAGTPTFDLGSAGFLSAKKIADVVAPEWSVEGSVDWLFLGDDGRGVGWGVQAVYRVETAGGKAPEGCVSVGDVQVPYAAEYWFYG